ncbi:MAG TPA: S1 RNA-binding domain-containing protein [Gemmataceae bacterium]|jgi:small subunit ribosomal protein S1|nr:S1 RNA-binding domain-containing protein [Gemmataceae bacterium]
MRDLDAEIEAELKATLSGMDEESLLGGEPGKEKREPRRGDAGQQQRGKIMRVHQGDVFVEMPGGRSQGLLPTTQFPDGLPNVGDPVDFHIERYDSANGLFLLSRQGQAVTANWSSVQIGQVVEARVTGTNKGGLSVDVNGIRGFLPISQIDMYRVEQPEQFLNQKLLCMVAEVNPAERNLVVSRRALLEQQRQEKSEQVWAEIKEGQIRKGVVRSVKPFGAFVDIGGVDGLVPVGEMAWKRVQDPSEVVQLGQAVEVAVLRVDRDARKLTLSLRQLTASPWEQVSANYPPRSMVRGTVTRTETFGAFVELEPGIEGLIHVSELAPNRVFNVRNVVKPGQEVEVMVLGVDVEKKRISLSLKQAQSATAPPPSASPTDPQQEEEETPPPKQRKHATPLRGGIGSSGPLFPELPNG